MGIINLMKDLNEIRFKLVDVGSDEHKFAVKLRENIYSNLYNVNYTEKALPKDDKYIHIVGLNEKKEVIATAILELGNKKCEIYGVAVKEDFRNQGIGSAIMSFCENYAVSLGCKEIYFNAREAAVYFYKKMGYVCEGEYFIEDTMPHIKMKKNIG